MDFDKVRQQVEKNSAEIIRHFNTHPQRKGQNFFSHAATMLTDILGSLFTAMMCLLHMLFPFSFLQYCYDRNSAQFHSVSDYELVKKFTVAAGTECSEKPTVMSRERVTFLIRMVCSEMQELALTVTDSTEEATNLVRTCVGADPSNHPQTERDDIELIAEQEDALADAWIYMLNVAAEHGQDVSNMFQVVMTSNMAKIDPSTGKCIRRESDGKILKPEGWEAPDTITEVKRQITDAIL